MKRSIFTFTAQFLVFLFCVAGIYSCEKRHKPFPPPEPTFIQLENSGELLLDGEAGSAEYFYTIINPIPTNTLVVVPDSETDWIHHIDLSVEGRVGFDYDANETGRVRVSMLDMSYGHVRTVMVIKQQKANPASN